jgi:hypothetical protein
MIDYVLLAFGEHTYGLYNCKQRIRTCEAGYEDMRLDPGSTVVAIRDGNKQREGEVTGFGEGIFGVRLGWTSLDAWRIGDDT